jgi:hypothetical protein
MNYHNYNQHEQHNHVGASTNRQIIPSELVLVTETPPIVRERRRVTTATATATNHHHQGEVADIITRTNDNDDNINPTGRVPHKNSHMWLFLSGGQSGSHCDLTPLSHY